MFISAVFYGLTPTLELFIMLQFTCHLSISADMLSYSAFIYARKVVRGHMTKFLICFGGINVDKEMKAYPIQ